MMGLLSVAWAFLSSRAGQVVAAVAGVLALLFAANRSGRKSARVEIRAAAAVAEQKAREKGDAAAAEAERAGAVDRLRSGRF